MRKHPFIKDPKTQIIVDDENAAIGGRNRMCENHTSSLFNENGGIFGSMKKK